VTRALWVTTEPPDRNLGGGSIREAYLLEALARKVETHLLLAGTLEDEQTRAVLASVIELDVPALRLPATRAQRRFDDLRRVLVDREPAAVVENRQRVRGLADHLGALGRFDLVCVEHDRLGPLIRHRRPEKARWTLTLHNLPSERRRHELALAGSRRQRWLYRRELADARRFEAAMVDAYDLVVVPSDADAAVLGDDVVVVPNGVDLARFRPTPLPSQPVVVFTGTLSWGPNIDGLTWFCRQVLPLVQAQVPDVRLDVVGREPLPEVERLARLAGVHLHADVATVVPWLEAARVAVVPLRIGSGTRLKALEAMAAGRPVVGTTVGLDGLAIDPGVHAVVADEPSSFAAAVVDLLVNDGMAGRVAAAGADHARTRFAWDGIGRRFVETVLDLGQTQAR
jgi:glycosyltransferase involved in cell wall biosynthesis